MFPSTAFQRDWLTKQAKVMAGCAPQILEKSLHALTLLGHLQEAGLPLIFRGGTSLLLHLPEIHRLSIDIDIMSAVAGAELERILAEVAIRAPFSHWEESVRDGGRLPKRRHFKFYYHSALGINELAPPSVMLDVVEENDVVHALETKIITTGFLQAEREITVQLPTLESLLGDKLTAFAPTTTGVPLRRTDGMPGEAVQVVKQLFDVGMLFSLAINGSELSDTYRRAQAKEANYRGGIHSLDATLDDTIATCLAATPFKDKVRSRFPDYPLLYNGYRGMRGHLTRPFSEEDFRRFAAQTATLAAHIKTGTAIDFASLRYTGTAEQNAAIKANSFNNTPWDWLDGLKQINPAAYHYWMQTSRLLKLIIQS
jgi:hypothetical protein